MPDNEKTITTSGHCVCGAIRFTAEALPAFHACHCGICRRWSSAPFFGVAAKALKIEEDATLKSYRSSDWATREFCGTCGTSLFWRGAEGDHVTISLGTLDNAEDFTLHREIFVDNKLKAYAFAGDHPKLTGQELLDSLGLS